MAGTITSIAFYNGGAERTRTYDFYLKTTTKSSFSSKTDWIAVSSTDKVFSGSVTMTANDWTFIIFDTPFEYDGTSNLVLVTDDNTGRYDSSPYMSCSVYNANGNQAIYAWDDNYNFNPLSPSSSNVSDNNVLSVKNHILLGIDTSVEQTTTLAAGWNWWAPTVELSVSDLETALGTNCILITSQSSGYLSYENGSWNGTLNAIVPGQMYKIETNGVCNLTVTGNSQPSVNITIVPGYNWFGYTGMQVLGIENLNIVPAEGDMINSQNEGYAIYENGVWGGTLHELQPGHGYVYNSNANVNKQLIFTLE